MPESCLATSSAQYCGSSPDHDCSDLNLSDGDGCSSSCSIEVGHSCDFNGMFDLCYDNAEGPIDNGSSDGGVVDEAQEPFCGDQIVNNDEDCDIGEPVDDDGCSDSCKQEEGY